MKNFAFALGFALLSTFGFANENPTTPQITKSVTQTDNLLGLWLQKKPGSSYENQGIAIYTEGMAESINLGKYSFSSWSIAGNKLTLKGTGGKIDFTITRDASGKITALNATSPIKLSLKKDNPNTSAKVATPAQAPKSSGASISGSDLLGKWLRPIPGMENMKEGFAIYTEGMAESVNSSTLVYQSWGFTDNKLTLKGISKGNKSESKFTETYIVKKDAKGNITLQSATNASIVLKR